PHSSTLSLHDALPISLNQLSNHQVPSIGQDKDEHFQGKRDQHRGKHEHAHGDQDRGHREVDDQEGQVKEESHLECQLELAQDKRDRKSTRLNSSHDQI